MGRGQPPSLSEGAEGKQARRVLVKRRREAIEVDL